MRFSPPRCWWYRSFGFKLMLLVNKVAVAAATALFIMGCFAFYPAFDAHYAGAFCVRAILVISMGPNASASYVRA